MRKSAAPTQIVRKIEQTEGTPVGLRGGKRKRSYFEAEEEEEGGVGEIVREPLLGGLGPLGMTVPASPSAPFKCPLPGYVAVPTSKTLGVRRRSGGFFVSAKNANRSIFGTAPGDENVDPLVLYNPDEIPAPDDDDGQQRFPILVDTALTKLLRPHQREGVKFMFDCVMGLKIDGAYGCILADDMGLGKTFQSITLLHTLLRKGIYGKPTVNKVVIVCPASLVNNWDQEIAKWLKGTCQTMPVNDTTMAQVVKAVDDFIACAFIKVMIISYETLRNHIERLKACKELGLVICDEAHRLKNRETITAQTINDLGVARRILLTGTPIQNALKEFYNMIDVCNPNLLGTPAQFTRIYESPILAGNNPDATEEQQALATERLGNLSEITNQFILRRTNTVLSKLLPPKLIQTVCVQMTPLQRELYDHFLKSKTATTLANGGKQSLVLASMNALMKLCNHPRLLLESESSTAGGNKTPGFEDIAQYFPPNILRDRRNPHPQMSGKMLLLDRLMAQVRKTTNDRWVLVSNYTQTLGLFEALCRERNYPCIRLDGNTTVAKRQKLVNEFNDPTSKVYAFLLSSKAGGCGINLIGANRLVLFDLDWNPANDKQALARVWREGQLKKCYIYRFLTAGSIEEKIYQRQLFKDGLSNMAMNEGFQESAMADEVLRDLFTLRPDCVCDTHDQLGCKRCLNVPAKKGDANAPQVGFPGENDLLSWSHHVAPITTNDDALRTVPSGVTFVMALEVQGKVTDPPPPKNPDEDAAAAMADDDDDGQRRSKRERKSKGYDDDADYDDY
eukprot:TRINITY_DN4015_c0_g1_i1.p1 TRINITY_DN4015_c0_g1~~TRINITY_DN4015_c0_g1_i1.p1  ORF type:complete len:791 (-),score=205.35 TRINITY_DN4015_c0_g1_i1:31-2403(-)